MSKDRLCARHRDLYVHVKAMRRHWPKPERDRFKEEIHMQCRACARLVPAALPYTSRDPEETP